MKTCVMDIHTHPWVDASKTSSNGSIFKALQKCQVGLPVKGSLKDAVHDLCAQKFWGYTRPSFSKDCRLLKHLKSRGLGLLSFNTNDNDTSSVSEVFEKDILVNSSNLQFKPLFKTMDDSSGRRNRLSKVKTTAQKDSKLSVD